MSVRIFPTARPCTPCCLRPFGCRRPIISSRGAGRWAIPTSGRSLAGGAVAGPHVAETGDDNAVVFALGTNTDRSLARLRAGEATSVVLLRATMSGLATCPVTDPLEIAETREVVQREVFGDKASHQMLLRIGWAPADAEPLPLTPRRQLHDVVKDLGWADGNAADRRTSETAFCCGRHRQHVAGCNEDWAVCRA
jgi:hypothetical protein